ncbi:hypothetical protein H0H81_008252 [Sphagnurus paluster]|uniref:Protein-S-isoprenylcysteine O-methyltransferase n=1 Tax=Sphagnurus paluster TaxID=117069 RepID=A0A9P7K4C2_9AGAR|nr:hypothetical protein H0H81_008252 [Sphagnurus paluster]
MTAPNPPPSAEERLPPTGLEHVAAVVPPIPKVGGHKAGQVFFWTASLAEITVILANCNPTYALSQRLFRFLARDVSSPTHTELSTSVPFLFGWVLALTGALIRQRCYRILDTKFTFELSIRKDHHLVTHGPYAYVRHPSHTGAILAGSGALLSVLAPGSWLRECSGLWPRDTPGMFAIFGVLVVGAAVAARAVRGRMEREDQMLRVRFGDEWERWAKKVPWKLVPGVY